MAGRHFDENDELLSMVSRQSIDVLKVSLYLRTALRIVFLIATYLQDTFRNDVSKDEWLLIKNLKGVSCLLSHCSTIVLTVTSAVEYPLMEHILCQVEFLSCYIVSPVLVVFIPGLTQIDRCGCG